MSRYETGETITSPREGVRCDGPGCDVRDASTNVCPFGWFEVRQGEYDPECGERYTGDEWHFHSLECLEAWAPRYADKLADQAVEFGHLFDGVHIIGEEGE